jgi:hypothetical protein
MARQTVVTARNPGLFGRQADRALRSARPPGRDELRAARGIIVSVLLGVGCWAVILGLAWFIAR